MAHTEIYDNSQTSSQGSPSNSSQGICAICLGVPKNKSFANNCLHEFCYICLVEWSKVKAECPLCMQHFGSIIYNVKFDHEYDELEIQKLGKCSSGSLPSHVLPPVLEQRQHNPALVHARNAQATIGNRLRTAAISARRQSIHTGNRRHSAVLPQSEQHTIAQSHPTETQQPRRIANAVRYSLRSRTIIRDDMDVTSNIELANELCPPSSPSTATIADRLLVSNITAEPVEKSQWWHNLVTTDMRTRMVQKLVRSIISDPNFVNENQRETVGAYVRQIEKDMYMTANSKHLYSTLYLEKITELKAMNENRKRILLQLIQSYDFSTSLPELDRTSSPREIARSSAIHKLPEVLDVRHFPAENFKDARNPLAEDVEDDELAILDIPPKPAPEVITLSDSDED